MTGILLIAAGLLIGLSDTSNVVDSNYVEDTYAIALREAGHHPVVIARNTDTNSLRRIVRALDVVLFTGGKDVEPSRYGAVRSPKCGASDPLRDAFEFALYSVCVAERKPIVGICRGMQTMNVFFGGTLYQDIPSEYVPPAGLVKCVHGKYPYSGGRTNPPLHKVSFVPGSRLARVLGTEPLMVNSHHHQGVKDLAPGFKVASRATDGFIEAMEHLSYPAFGVQFHPENTVARRPQTGFDLPRHRLFFERLEDLLATVSSIRGLSNEFVRVEFDAKGCVSSIRENATGRELIGEKVPFVSIRLKDGSEIAPVSCAADGTNGLLFGFPRGLGSCRLTVMPFSGGWTFETSSCDITNAEVLTLGRLVPSCNREKGSLSNIVMDDRSGVVLRGYVPEIDMDESGRESAIAPLSLSSDVNRGAYLFATWMDLESADDWIRLMDKAGCQMFHLHAWWLHRGSYEVNPLCFPNGLADMKKLVDRLHAAGKRVSTHSLSAVVQFGDPHIVPAWFDDLATDASYALARPSQRTLSRAEYPSGTRVDYLHHRYAEFVPKPKSRLAEELTDRLAEVFNTLGLDGIYFDGSEAMGSHFAIDWMRERTLAKLRPRNGTVVNSASCRNPFNWWNRSLAGTWDHPTLAPQHVSFGKWERARYARAFRPDLLERMRTPGEDWRLRQDDSGAWIAIPFEVSHRRIASVDSAAWKVALRNTGPASLRVEALYAVDRSAKGVRVLDASRLPSLVRASNDGVTLSVGNADASSASLPGTTIRLEATNVSAAPNAAWAGVFRTFPEKEPASFDAVSSLWVKGPPCASRFWVRWSIPSSTGAG